MKQNRSKRFLAMILALVMVVTTLALPAAAVQKDTQVVGGSVESANDREQDEIFVSEEMKHANSREVTIMVSIPEDTAYIQTGDLQLAVSESNTLMAAYARAEANIELALAEKIEVENRYSLLFNGFSFTGEEWMIDAINQIDGLTAFEAPVFELIAPESEGDMELTPSMGKSTVLTGAANAWDLGYSGEGMTIAVIDTGIRQSHEAFSVAPESPKMDLAYLQDVYSEYGEYIHAGTANDLNDIYYSEKLPFNWDYFDNDAIPNHTASDHGSHVAGITAGNNGSNFKGIAPNAQIVTMQVFTSSGGAAFDTVLAALEDCVYLGVDAINMSLGLTAGFKNYLSVGIDMEPVYTALENAGITIAVAAGNDTTAYRSDSTFSTGYWSANNPDNGLVCAPAIFEGSFAVASITNADINAGYHMVAYGAEYGPVDSTNKTTPSFTTLGYETYDLIYVGTASLADLEGLDLTGKIALATRDTYTTYQNKVNNVQAAGAIGVLIYNNVPGSVKTSASSTIPVGSLTLAEGESLVRAMAGGEGKITIAAGTAYSALTMATTSSWGTTPELEIKPEITAPGGTINSVDGTSSDSSYKNLSGTSMATPHVAGALVIVKQHLREVFPEATASEINDLAYTYLMDTAHQVNGFVRQQGAGVIDVDAALTTQAYLSVPGESRPKLELGDDAEGNFTFTFVVNNVGDTEKVYSITQTAMTEYSTNYSHNGVDAKRINGSVKDVTGLCDFTGPTTVTVPAGGTAEVTMSISLTEELAAYYASEFASGMYLEGFIKLVDQAENGVDLSIPYLGFVGDWNYPSMIDDGFYWQNSYGVYNPAQNKITNGTYIGSGIQEQGLGLNPYADMNGQTYSADRNAISPNNDGFLDSVDYIEFAILRSPRTVKFYLQDEAGNVLDTYVDATYSYRKEYCDPNINGGMTYSSNAFEFTGEEIEENETAYLVLEAWLDREGFDPAENKNARLVFPVTKDTSAPEVSAVEGGIQVLDTNYIAYYAVYADVDCTEQIFETGVFAMERGQEETYTTDLTTYYVAAADYARNEAFYMVENGEVTRLEADGFGHSTKTAVGRLYKDYHTGEETYAFVEYNPETHLIMTPVTEITSEPTPYNNGSGQDFRTAAIDKDGTVYLTSKDHLLKLDPETYEVTEVARYWLEGDYIFNAQCLTVDPETFEFYVYSWTNALGGWSYAVCKVDIETGLITPLWSVPSKFGTVSTSSGIIGMTFVDTGVLAMPTANGYICLANAETGASIQNIDLRNYYGKSGTSGYLGLQGSGGDLLYDADSNMLYIYSEWQWFHPNHYDLPGMITVDLNNNTAQMHTVGTGDGVFMHGLYFKEDAKPQAWYTAMQLIEAIGEVEIEDGEAIAAAREAYDALSEKDKAHVENYESLLTAEHTYAILCAEAASFDAAKCYAKVVLEDLEKTDISGLNAHQVELFEEAIAAFKQAMEEAKSALDVAAALEELFAVVDHLDTLCGSAAFSDVDVSKWYHEAVDYVVLNGLMNGMDKTTFAPDDTLTRAQLVTILYRLEGEPTVEGLENPFGDVAEDRWYTDAIIWAANAGVVTGKTATVFDPDAAITREQIATILYRYAGAEEVEENALEGYTDAAKVSPYAVNAMNWAVTEGLITGTTGTTLEPTATATRAQIATILMRYCEK